MGAWGGWCRLPELFPLRIGEKRTAVAGTIVTAVVDVLAFGVTAETRYPSDEETLGPVRVRPTEHQPRVGTAIDFFPVRRQRNAGFELF